MSAENTSTGNSNPADSNAREAYVVIARRYRPQSFLDMVGQEHVTKALENAIATNRVGHAYLFTGARGVGKTSLARIFAKALNCQQGLSSEPCNSCDICLGIANGDDIDVLEIDGASNRQIDDIRRLRSNVAVRPSRGRYKIYIIDEVHMLTKEAFNALLKTLEEPPEHVKFMFCTTNPEKILETILSRCQRFDFSPVKTASILNRLQLITQQEGLQVDEDALQLLARRAQGSMRDGQSLLEQVLSFSQGQVTVGDVHTLLGTVETRQLAELVQHASNGDTIQTLAVLDKAIDEGIDLGQLAEQLLGYYRDLMAATAGCDVNLMRHSSPDEYELLGQLGQQLGMETILAILQLLDETLARMRTSTQPRTLVEMVLTRICYLERLDDLSTLVTQLQQNPSPPGPARPGSPATSQPVPQPSSQPVSELPSPSASGPASTTQLPTGSDTPSVTPAAPPAKAAIEPTRDAQATTPLKKNEENVNSPLETVSEPFTPLAVTPESAEQIWQQTL
ncbi:MAG: DNA polymerase III subunit gamma/tau, partial [Pirellulaceae bacterium]|nr:DNA polymerase III subunit gamma/tau [Pirellulaceae bacterium]